MKTRLVVLIDFSPSTTVLTEFAKKWNEVLNTEILFIHKLNFPFPGLAIEEERENLIDFEKEKVISELNTIIKNNFPDDKKVTFKILEKGLINSLPKYLGKEYNDILILALKETGVLKKIFLGSTALNIIEQINFTTITIPFDFQHFVPKSLTIALNIKYPLNKFAFNGFLNAVVSFIEEITFVSVITPKDNFKKNHEYLMKLAHEYDPIITSSFELVKGESVVNEIKEFTARNPETKLVVQKGARSISDLLFRKFMLNDLVFDSSIPIIILPSL